MDPEGFHVMNGLIPSWIRNMLSLLGILIIFIIVVKKKLDKVNLRKERSIWLTV